MMKSVAVCLVGCVAWATVAAGEVPARPTFTKDVLPILQENCQECHRAAGSNFGGMIAPMALTTYDEARPWAKSIVIQITSREMPPWDADPAFNGIFRNERILTEDEIATIVRWVETGASRGAPKDAPAPRSFQNNGGWNIGSQT